MQRTTRYRSARSVADEARAADLLLGHPESTDLGALALLSALIDTRGHGAVTTHETRWTSSLQGEIGAGYDIRAELIEGEHHLAVTAPDGIGGLLTG